MSRYDHSQNSKRFWFSVPGLRLPPNNRADNQREINHAEQIASHVNLDEQSIYIIRPQVTKNGQPSRF